MLAISYEEFKYLHYDSELDHIGGLCCCRSDFDVCSASFLRGHNFSAGLEAILFPIFDTPLTSRVLGKKRGPDFGFELEGTMV